LNTAVKYSLLLPLEIELCKKVLLSTLRSIKTCQFYFLNSFVKHWPILINFGRQY